MTIAGRKNPGKKEHPMESKKKKKLNCKVGGKTYSHGTQACESRRCFECNDGRWEERFIDRVFGVGP